MAQEMCGNFHQHELDEMELLLREFETDSSQSGLDHIAVQESSPDVGRQDRLHTTKQVLDRICSDFHSSSERIRHSLLADVSSLRSMADEFTSRHSDVMSSKLKEKFWSDLRSSIRKLENSYQTELSESLSHVGNVSSSQMERVLREEFEAMQKRYESTVAQAREAVEEQQHREQQKRVNDMKRSLERVHARKEQELYVRLNKESESVLKHLERELELESSQRLQRAREKFATLRDEKMKKLTAMKENELSQALKSERLEHERRLAEDEARWRSQQEFRLREMRKSLKLEAEKGRQTRLQQLREEHERERAANERTLRKQTEEESERIVERERKKARMRLNAREKKLKNEIQQDRHRYIEKIRCQEEASIHLSLHKLIENQRRQTDSEELMLRESIRNELKSSMNAKVAEKRARFEQRREQRLQELREQLELQAETEHKQLACKMEEETQTQLNALRDDYRRRTQRWRLDIEAAAAADRERALAALQVDLSHAQNALVEDTRQELVEAKQKFLSAHQRRKEDALDTARKTAEKIGASVRWCEAELPLLERLEELTKRMAQLHSENALLRKQLDAAECDTCESLLAANAQLMSNSYLHSKEEMSDLA